MSRLVSPSVNRRYGVHPGLGQVAGHAVPASRPTRRATPQAPAWSGRADADEGLVEAIRALLADRPFHGEGHRKVWARLRCAGIRTSKRRVLRLMREHDLLAPGRIGRPHGPRAHDGTIRTERVDQMWGTDPTSTPTGEGQASILVTVDHGSTECVGIHAARRATRFEALEPAISRSTPRVRWNRSSAPQSLFNRSNSSGWIG
jgi:putative transposase